MIQRFDQIVVDLPEPNGPNPAAAAAIQELMGGKFGEMSTLMNYTFQSFNFRGREKYRPFYDLICNIAAEEYSHIEAVSAAINLLLSGATPRADRNKPFGEDAASKKSNALIGRNTATRIRLPFPIQSHRRSWQPTKCPTIPRLARCAAIQWLIEKLDKKPNAIRKAGAWVAEKLSRAKIHPGESPEGEMGLYLALEGLVLGITGKCVLWRGLEAAAVDAPELRGLDYAQLQVRAKEQRDRVEAKRLELALRSSNPRRNTRDSRLAPAGLAFFCRL